MFNLSVGMCVQVCLTFVVFTDCESCTRPISINPESMQVGEYGLTRGKCSSHAVSSCTRWSGCCGFRGVFWVGRIFSFFFFSIFFFFERTRPAESMRPPCLIYLSTVSGCVQGAIIKLVCPSVCPSVYLSSVCVTFNVLLIARAVRGRIPQTWDPWKRASVGERVGRVSSHAVSRWSRSLG